MESGFLGTIGIDDTFYAVSAMNIVLAHTLTSADDETHNATVTTK
jgi:hypothetical protein